ncbi:MAG: 4Fe-4S dicluster domain-containing protein [Kiritimatiellae bacterium]|nr:4Fe-4S dicluster domain-containing protein [Kiritimatiellia bacterium]MDD5521122.1 4Fe-4S dicluster domain-containing protein [Kiritimatiellia bacterium]
MKRNIINIDHEKCTGCGLCIPNCPEGAIQMIDGKARLVSDLFCDGLGACLGHCPVDAISIEEREAEKYDEKRVMENIVKQGENVIKAHLSHLRNHKQDEYLQQAISFLKEKKIRNPIEQKESNTKHVVTHPGCPGSKSMKFDQPAEQGNDTGKRVSQLTHWPIQLHLMSPEAPQYQSKDILLAADCTAFTVGDFHKDFLKGKSLIIACPKLDDGQDIYVEKIKALIDNAKINTLTVMIMQVPCCRGLLALAKDAANQASRKVPVKCIVVGIQGDILSEDWV